MSVNDHLPEIVSEDQRKENNNNNLELDIEGRDGGDSITDKPLIDVCDEIKDLSEKETNVTVVKEISHGNITVEEIDSFKHGESDFSTDEHPPKENIQQFSDVDVKENVPRDYEMHTTFGDSPKYVLNVSQNGEMGEKSSVNVDTSGNIGDDDSHSAGEPDKTKVADIADHDNVISDCTDSCEIQGRDDISNSHTEEIIDIFGNGKLTKQIIKKGLGSETRPGVGVSVTIKYKAWNSRGHLFAQEQETIILGDGDVVQAFEFSLPLAESGELFELISNECFAYGAKGWPSDVDPGETVKYHVELLSVGDRPNYEAYSYKERLDAASTKRERGNFLYRREEFAQAIHSYSCAIKIIQSEPDFKSTSTDSPKGDLFDLFIKLSNNLAASQLKLENYEGAIETCDNVLSYDANNVKALFRKGKSLRLRGSLDTALITLTKAIELDSTNRLIEKEIQICGAEIRSRDGTRCAKPDQCKKTAYKYAPYVGALLALTVSVYLATVAFSKSKGI